MEDVNAGHTESASYSATSQKCRTTHGSASIVFTTSCVIFNVVLPLVQQRGVNMDLRLKKVRKQAGLKQKELAEKIGVDWRTYGSWERGERNMSFAQACNCCDVLGCSLDELAGREWRPSFSDPQEEELHRCWQVSTDENRHALLVMARNSAGESLNVADPARATTKGT